MGRSILFSELSEGSPTVSYIRIPYCFLLLGGIVTGLSLLGLCLVSVCEKAALEAKQELPSLDMKEVIRTKIFYQVIIVTYK